MTGVFVAVVAAGLLIAWLIDDKDQAVVGGVAPDFTVELLDGGTFILSEHLANDGRPLILNLWASWCGPCRAEIPYISSHTGDNDDVAVLGVAVEDRLDKAIEFSMEVEAAYPLAIGDEVFREHYPSIGLPATYFINPDGIVANLWNGVVTAEQLHDGFN